jgi:acyl-CoA dehydrogenase
LPEALTAARYADVLDEAAPRSARAVWRALGSAGILTDLYEAGRPRADRMDALLAVLDERQPLGLTLSVCVQVASVLPALDSGAEDPAARERARALRGEAVGGLAATDAGAPGSRLTELTTTLEVSGDQVTLTGGKRWIVNATDADYFVVLARHRPGEHFTSFTQVLVPATAPGVRARPANTTFFDGSGVGHLDFDQVRLDRDHVVGGLGHGLVRFARCVTTERLAGALWGAALARRVLVRTRHHLRARELWDDNAVRQRFARCLVALRRMEATCATAGSDPGLTDGMVLKAGNALGLEEILTECAQLHGADGFGADSGIQRLRAETAMFGIAGGTTETMLAGIADHADELLEKR